MANIANFAAPVEMALSGAGAQFGGPMAKETAQFVATVGSLKEIWRQEEHLGLIRELTPPDSHIGLQFCPWMEVETDDVVFDFVKSSGAGMAPAVSQDAESKLFQDIDDITGEMRASIIDWRHKSRYSSSDVMTYREFSVVKNTLEGAGQGIPRGISKITDGFPQRVARDTARRRLWLDNRIEWMILTSLSTGKLVYADGQIKFNVDWRRPADQHNQAPESGTYAADTHDPINDVLAIKEKMYQEKYVNMTRAICTSKFINRLYRSAKFIPRNTGYLPSSGIDASDIPYLTEGWGPKAALDLIERETGVQFIVNDNVFVARNFQTGAVSNQRFIPENQVIFLPDQASIDLIDDTEVGFGKMLTSPHPMGDFQPGFYSWEQEETDPWQHVIGSGVKAFPVFPHMDLTYTMTVTL